MRKSYLFSTGRVLVQIQLPDKISHVTAKKLILYEGKE